MSLFPFPPCAGSLLQYKCPQQSMGAVKTMMEQQQRERIYPRHQQQQQQQQRRYQEDGQARHDTFDESDPNAQYPKARRKRSRELRHQNDIPESRKGFKYRRPAAGTKTDDAVMTSAAGEATTRVAGKAETPAQDTGPAILRGSEAHVPNEDGGDGDDDDSYRTFHRNLVAAIFQIGLQNASPAVVTENMIHKATNKSRPGNESAASVNGNTGGADSSRELTSERLKSHLQKYRLVKSNAKKKFLEEYDRTINQLRSIGLGNPNAFMNSVASATAATTLSKGPASPHLTRSVTAPIDRMVGPEVVAYATFSIMCEEEEGDGEELLKKRPQGEETVLQVGVSKENGVDATSEHQGPEGRRTSIPPTGGTASLPSIVPASSPAVASMVKHVHNESGFHCAQIRMPELTAEEQATPLGSSFLYLRNLIGYLGQYLAEQRVDKVMKDILKIPTRVVSDTGRFDHQEGKSSGGKNPSAARVAAKADAALEQKGKIQFHQQPFRATQSVLAATATPPSCDTTRATAAVEGAAVTANHPPPPHPHLGYVGNGVVEGRRGGTFVDFLPPRETVAATTAANAASTHHGRGGVAATPSRTVAPLEEANPSRMSGQGASEDQSSPPLQPLPYTGQGQDCFLQPVQYQPFAGSDSLGRFPWRGVDGHGIPSEPRPRFSTKGEGQVLVFPPPLGEVIAAAEGTNHGAMYTSFAAAASAVASVALPAPTVAAQYGGGQTENRIDYAPSFPHPVVHYQGGTAAVETAEGFRGGSIPQPPEPALANYQNFFFSEDGGRWGANQAEHGFPSNVRYDVNNNDSYTPLGYDNAHAYNGNTRETDENYYDRHRR